MRKNGMQDAELAALAQAGDRAAFGELVQRYAGQARRVARSILHHDEDADDAAQDGFLTALRQLGRYDATRPFGPWLMRIVANKASDRRRRRRVRAAQPLGPRLSSEAPGPDEAAHRAGLRAALRAALAKLPERQRLAVVLFDVEDYRHAEIAEILDVPVGTVRSDVFHARRALRETLGAWRERKEEKPR
ncbi:MAG: sigma-70 family RNA polymerase sigma factor [Gemmatimonadales bacterium]|jgi:RNA polymerase sigma-70 factor (ECF subfamily)